MLFLENPNDGVQVPPAPCSLACALGSSGLHLQKVQLAIQGYRKGQQLSILGKDSNWLCSVFLEQGSHCEGRRGPPRAGIPPRTVGQLAPDRSRNAERMWKEQRPLPGPPSCRDPRRLGDGVRSGPAFRRDGSCGWERRVKQKERRILNCSRGRCGGIMWKEGLASQVEGNHLFHPFLLCSSPTF